MNAGFVPPFERVEPQLGQNGGKACNTCELVGRCKVAEIDNSTFRREVDI
jgi:hypothetical protein